MKRFLFLLFILLPVSIMFSQDTINVPGDYSTIQAAINAANTGDLVLVADGTYQENINFKGKAITVASHYINDPDTSHITHTIIDGSNPSHPDTGSVVLFISGEDTTSVLKGFTIRNGSGTLASSGAYFAGGIGVWQSGAKICNNIIEYNLIDSVSNARGGGILAGDDSNNNIIIKNNVIRNNVCNVTGYAIGGGLLVWTNGYMLISNNIILDNKVIAGIGGTGGGIDVWGPINQIYIVSNLIEGNSVQVNNGGGGGIDIYECTTNTPVIENNIIVGNYSSAYGGGILVDLDLDNSLKPELNQHQSTVPYSDDLAIQYLTNNTLYNNSAGVSGGGIYTADMTSNIMNCIIWGNSAISNPQIAGTVDVTYSDVEGGWSGTGNMDQFPLFDMNSEFYHLLSYSPCIDSGNPGSQYNDVEDPNNLGNSLYPAHATLRNDIGHGGGPASLWGYWEWPIPVELTSFIATVQFGKVNLYWTTVTETNNLGFEIERRIKDNQGVWVFIGFKEGLGTSTEKQEYFYSDDISDISATSFAYRLKQIDFDGSYEYSEEVFVDNPEPMDFSLMQNYPNPFNPSTTIKYALPVKSNVELDIYNMLGEKIMQLVYGEKEAGTYTIEFDASNLPSGVYFYEIKIGDFKETKKMILMK